MNSSMSKGDPTYLFVNLVVTLRTGIPQFMARILLTNGQSGYFANRKNWDLVKRCSARNVVTFLCRQPSFVET